MEETRKRPRRAFITGLMAVAFFAFSLVCWFFVRKAGLPVTSPSAAGIVDMNRAMMSHPNWPSLEKLYEERRAAENAITPDEPAEKSPDYPHAAQKPFDDAATQKLKQEIIRSVGEFMEVLGEAERAYREEMQPDYEAARKEIDDIYFNEILNIRLKLDNADVMKLSPEERKRLAERLAALRSERRDRQLALRDEYEGRVRAFRAEREARHAEETAELNERLGERLRAEEAMRQVEANMRNFEAMQRALLSRMEAKERARQRALLIRTKDREIAAAESAMKRDISEKAARLASRRGLSVIFASPAENLAALAPISPRVAPPPAGTEIIGIDAEDVTDELISLLK